MRIPLHLNHILIGYLEYRPDCREEGVSEDEQIVFWATLLAPGYIRSTCAGWCPEDVLSKLIKMMSDPDYKLPTELI